MFFSAPFFWKSFTSPGCDTDARSGGLPPATAVDSTVGVLSPVDLYLTLMPGFAFRNPSRTASNDFCSSPVQTPTMLMLPLTFVFCAPATPLPLLLCDAVLFAPQPAATATTATSAPATTSQLPLTCQLLSGSHRSHCLFRGRRNGVPACRRRLRSARPASRATARRSARP